MLANYVEKGRKKSGWISAVRMGTNKSYEKLIGTIPHVKEL